MFAGWLKGLGEGGIGGLGTQYPLPPRGDGLRGKRMCVSALRVHRETGFIFPENVCAFNANFIDPYTDYVVQSGAMWSKMGQYSTN